MKLDLVVVQKSKVSGQLMELRILPTLLDKMKVAQREDPKLQKFREQMEVVVRMDMQIHTDGILLFGSKVCIPEGWFDKK